MVAKMGRPVLDDPKDFLLRVRLNREELEKLDRCCDVENTSRSGFVRKAIEERYAEIKK